MKVLLTGGRAPATLELARLLFRAGHRVEVAESQAFPLTRFSNCVALHHRLPRPRQESQDYLQHLRELASNFDLLIPTCEETFWVASADIPQAWCPPLAKLRRLHSKLEFQQRVAEHGLEALPTWRCREGPECLDGRHVLKPEFSRFARAVKIRPRSWPGPGDWIAQPYLDGQEYSALLLCREGQVLAWAAYANRVRWGQGAALRFTHEVPQGLQEWLFQFAQAEGHTGFLAFDLMLTPEGRWYALECNPRLTSGLHLLAACPGLSDVLWHTPGEPLQPRVGETAQLGLALLLQGHWPGRARDVIWDLRDPWPFWAQPLSLLSLARFGRDLTAASTWDIEWNG